MQRLWRLYNTSVLPIEELCFFDHFKQRPVTEQEFMARPQVLLLGQYSTGKTTMIKWLTGSDSTYFNIKPEPSTDKFMAVVHGSKEGQPIGGAAATCMDQAPYKGLSVFGSDFLRSFQALSLQSELLKKLTLVDTPGVLPNQTDSIRNYDFASVIAWLAERADMILLMFDAHKLDISDEFQRVLEALRPHADRVHCLLNKADRIPSNDLLRVYGALMWNIAKVMRTPEVMKVSVSSFWDQEYYIPDHKVLFDSDRSALMQELMALPSATVMRRTNVLVERMRRVRAYYCILSFIRSQIPLSIRIHGSQARLRQWLQANLQELLLEAQRHHKISRGDMPQAAGFGQALDTLEGVWRLPNFSQEVHDELCQAIDSEVPRIIQKIHGVSAGDMAAAAATAGEQRPPLLERLGLGTPCAKRRRLSDD